MAKSCVATTFLWLLLLFLQTHKNVHAGFYCYGDFFTVSYGVSRDYLFSSLPSNVVANGGFYNASFGKESQNNRVHVVALCRRGFDNQACKKCLEHVIENTKNLCPRQVESYSWVTDQANEVSCFLRYTNHSTFGKLELSPVVVNPNPNSIEPTKNMTRIMLEWTAMVNLTLEAASTANSSSVLKYYSATGTELTQISGVYALMQCTPDLSPSDCRRCLTQNVNEFQRQYWGRQGGGTSRPSCYFRWDLFAFYKAFDNVYSSSMCYGDSFPSNYGESNRDHLFSSLPSNVVANGGFHNASFGNESQNNRVHVVALCRRGFDNQACKTCLENVTEDTKIRCHQVEFYTWVTDQANEVSCFLRYTNHSTFGKLELSPAVVNGNLKSIVTTKNMTRISLEWTGMVNQTLEAASTADSSSVLKYYSATITEFTDISDVYALMQCTPDLSPSDCRRCLTQNVNEFQRQYWGRVGGGTSRPSCDFRWELFPFDKAFDNVAFPPQISSTTLDCVRDKNSLEGSKIAIIVVPSVINLLIFVGLIFFLKRKLSHSGINSKEDGKSMFRFDLQMILIATNEFSPENKLGQGGFGSVYKGTLPDGREVAVKRLARGSGQGDIEFKNEVSLLTRLQHRNLVKLFGFCSENDEEILVYEFVPNSSLDHFIFDEEKRSLLTWEVRCRIIEGIARGLLYLHEDSQLKIIHRDLKASNILLDEEMNPKVADFGTARLFETDETRAETKRIAGTRGYMAPEYLNHGQISAKSDVYGFGVMLLEMISGEKSNSFEGEGLPAFAWKRWVEEKPEIIIDHLLIENPRNEIIKLIQIGLLCVQENAAKRPTMSSVIMWLGSETIIIPLPKAPAFTWTQSETESDIILQMSDVFTELTSR